MAMEGGVATCPGQGLLRQLRIDGLSMNAFSPRLNRKGTLPRAARASVSMPASVVTMSAYQFPELADISQTGAKLRGSPFPPRGTTALLRAGALEVLCRVVWVQDDHCGIRFDEPVSPKILKQVQLDGAVALDTFGPVGED